MAYQASYRAWRPQKFSEVVGQEKTVTALRNAVAAGKLAHAYLFFGPRGTGKTSVAKILAKAVNCPHQAEGEPCDECASCRDIRQGSFMDVIEIDAASNRGIDQIRDLREQVRILPAQGKKKVYIIDEAHMLTPEASNALLKTLEEPPESVIFILATTEAERLLPTIVSRCQRYAFRRLTTEEIKERLVQVAAERGAEVEPPVYDLIARRAFGGMRDALSIFDQVLAAGGGNASRATALAILGMVEDDIIQDLFEAAWEQKVEATLELVDQILGEGREPYQVIRQMTYYLRDVLVLQAMGDKAAVTMTDPASINRMKRHARDAGREALLKGWGFLAQAADGMRFSDSQRYQMELALLQMGREMNTSEKVPAAGETRAAESRRTSERRQPAASSPAHPAAENGGLKWDQVLERVKAQKVTVSALLAPARLVGYQDSVVIVGYRKGFKFHKERMTERENRELLERVIEELLGHPVEVSFIFLDDGPDDDPVVRKALELFGADKVHIRD